MFTKTNQPLFLAKSDISLWLARAPSPPMLNKFGQTPFFICAKELPTETEFNTRALSTSLTSDWEKEV
jgi:hypothetical protein